MLKDDFFTIKETADAETGRTYRVTLNALHPVFPAHFFGNPIVPGACIAQMIKELASDYLSTPFFISAIKNMKFLKIISPLENPEISVHITCTAQENENIFISSVINDGDSVFFKAILVLKPAKKKEITPLPALQRRMEALRLCVVIPTYNNRKTLACVINDVLQQTTDIIVVNDGSTDDTAEILNGFSGKVAEVVSYMPNRGKGFALKSGFNRAEKLGYKGALTIDSDGQHLVADMETFVGYAEKYPGALLLGQRTVEGRMPAKNSFANKFSNFWFAVYTAYRFNDTQNGFRLYPLASMKGLRPLFPRYEAELEILVRSAWKGLAIVPVPAHVYYPPAGEHVTHFRPRKDFFRISALNLLFFILTIVYGYPLMLFHRLLMKKRQL
ncbi:MAG: glycosyltransferase [Tannerella sp.]|jgi:3-hydroxymyristoyl/3-hydroxydecanoyl-(acyl carrier protein) dehydratase|nr:glycosyltransferase [Tannerella sp.]